MNPDQNEIERLRAITHPARWRVLQVLWSGRTLTATQAADIAGITPSAMSYHLRHLAKLGMIERLESDDGRERPWRSISDAPHITLQPDVQLGTAMMQNLMYSVSRTVGAAPPESGDTRPWPAAYSQGTLKLTRAQAKELNRRIGELIDEFEGVADVEMEGPCVGAQSPSDRPELNQSLEPNQSPDSGQSDDVKRYTYDAIWILGAQPDGGN